MSGEGSTILIPGQRIQYKGERGTVRYVGPIEGQGVANWVGVEWDNVARGKHDGAYGEKRYFSCKPGSGSFIKSEKLGNGGRRTLVEAVLKRYTQDALDTSFRQSTVRVGGELISIEERDEDLKRRAALASIETIDASSMGVCAIDRNIEWSDLLPKLRHLRIANVLVDNVHEISTLLSEFDHLQTLDASKNVLGLAKNNEIKEECASSHPLEELVLNGSPLTWDGVFHVISHTPSLKSLRLHNCGLKSLTRIDLCTRLPALRTVDLDRNNLSWNDIFSQIAKLPNLEEAYLSSNNLPDCTPPDTDCFLKTRILSLASNDLQGWKIVSWLNSLHSLTNLRIRGNPISSANEDLDLRLTWRMRVIGRISHIKVLDGSTISSDERLISEKRYTSDEILRALKSNPATVSVIHPRAEELRAAFGDNIQG